MVRKVRNPNGTTKTYRGEEAEQLTASELLAFRNRLASMSSDDLMACMVEAPKSPEAILEV